MKIPIFIETPLLDEIALHEWFLKKYSVGEMKEVENLIKNHIWITDKKIKIPVKQMTVAHIKNCIRCWHGIGKLRIPKGYLGGKKKWLEIFEQELISRQ